MTTTSPGVRLPDVPVLVVGGGPTGLTAANLLAIHGVDVLLVERNATTSDEAKAISLDDESMRTLQAAGLADEMSSIIVPGTGTRYYGAHGQSLVHARGAGSYRFGHPFKNPFAQPELERVLRDGLARFPCVQARFGTELVDLHEHADGVEVRLVGADGAPFQVRAQVVLGCDGGRSPVRELLGVPMTGRGFDEVWLVVDTLDDPHDQRYGMHHGDPRRPHLVVPGRDGRCRYEFLLRPEEGAAGETPPFALVRDLVAPYRSLRPEQLERAVSYRFHALLADRLRVGRCFLLGDAAHMMPPFAGQGLNSGLRDATNLTWKVADVLAGRADDRLLDTYDTERRPHARAMIDLSVRLGRIVFTTDRRRAALRDLLVAAAMRTGPGGRYLTEMRYRPRSSLLAGAVVPRTGPGAALVGSPLPQPRVLLGAQHQLVLLDEALGGGWSVLGVDVDEAAWRRPGLEDLPTGVRVDVVLGDRAARPRAGRYAVADADGTLEALLSGCRGHLLLVRPDRVVAAVFRASDIGPVVLALGAAGALEPAIPAPVEPMRAPVPTHHTRPEPAVIRSAP